MEFPTTVDQLLRLRQQRLGCDGMLAFIPENLYFSRAAQVHAGYILRLLQHEGVVYLDTFRSLAENKGMQNWCEKVLKQSPTSVLHRRCLEYCVGTWWETPPTVSSCAIVTLTADSLHSAMELNARYAFGLRGTTIEDELRNMSNHGISYHEILQTCDCG